MQSVGFTPSAPSRAPRPRPPNLANASALVRVANFGVQGAKLTQDAYFMG